MWAWMVNGKRGKIIDSRSTQTRSGKDFKKQTNKSGHHPLSQDSGSRGRQISLNLRPAWATFAVPGQVRIYHETLSLTATKINCLIRNSLLFWRECSLVKSRNCSLKDPNSVPRTSIRRLATSTSRYSSSWGLDLWPLQAPKRRCMSPQHIHNLISLIKKISASPHENKSPRGIFLES